MSLQVCHCGWSKVTTYHGLITHQGKMGCTSRGVKVEESEQQYMWGHIELTNNQKDFELDLYTSIETDYYSDKSLQICQCGWSKVTTYQGLRTHQGMMGCTPKGVKVEANEQQYMWGHVGLTDNQKDFRLDVDTSIKTDTTDYYSGMSLQVCHCGWSKVTTYQGLRIHQGKMGCTPKKTRSPKTEECDWNNQGEEVGQRKHQPAKRTTVKKENAPLRPSTNSRTISAEKTIKVENKSSFATPQHSSQRATHPKAGHQLQGSSTHPQRTDSRAMTGYWSHTDSATAAAFKEEPKTPTLPRSSQRATNSMAGHQMQDSSTHPQVNGSDREHPTPTYPVTVVRPKKKDRKDQTLSQKSDHREMAGNWSINSCTDSAPAATIKEEPKSPLAIPQQSFHTASNSKLQDFSTGVQVNRSVGERPTVPRITVVPPKERDHTLSQVKSLVRERPTTTDPATVVRPKGRGSNIGTAFTTPQRSFQTGTNSKAGHQLQDFSTGVQLNRSVGECPRSSPLATVGQPKEKDRKDHSLSQARQEGFQSELQWKIQMKKENNCEIRPAERACESAPDSKCSNIQPISAAAEATKKKDPESLCETAQPDFSTGMKLKELARMFSVTTTQETAVRPKKKHREEQKLSQVKLLAQKLSAATTAQITEVQPKEKEREDPKLPQNVPDTRSATTQMNAASGEATTEDPKIDSSTGTKLALSVKELARMFSATSEETAVQLKGKHREEKLSQVRPSVKHVTEVNLFAQKLSATTAQETAGHPKEKDMEVQNLPQVRPDRNAADTAVKDKIQTREQKVAQGRSSVKARKGSSEAKRLEITSVFSEVVRVAENAKQKSLDLSLSTLRTTTSTMMEQIQQNLDKLSAIELKWISKFAVDVKLDPTTTHRCLVSVDGKKVSSGGENQDAPGSFGSVLGLNRLTSGKSYWEVVVSNKTGWNLGVARGGANREGKLALKPDNGYWVAEHYENKYAALTATPVCLSLKEKPQKVGVFVDYEESLVSFYDVTAQSHIYSFTECWFTGEIYPYFSLHLKGDGQSANSLIISTVKHQ
ncbi:uncharacterized protein LOC116053263 [Sander lucioperca]|uniref:uncharacterized protein LOC116053263 n=1 Tax=Sander lucioperca TaxID=283035 RepID=UPI00125D8A98|nr:uncharacterized protein LOC116053263 [Sander lucioperca]